MKTIRDFIDKPINESPANAHPDVDIIVNDNLTKVIIKAFKNDNVYETNNPNIYKCAGHSVGYMIYMIIKDDSVIGATSIFSSNLKHSYRGKTKYICYPKISKKYNDKEKGILFQLYRHIQFNENLYIMGDGKQTDDSKQVWLHWLTNDVDYIKDWFIYDTKTKEAKAFTLKKLHKYWSNNLNFSRYRPLVIFE